MVARLKANDIIDLEIVDLAATGKSVGKVDGLVVLADEGLPGELIECQITGMKRSFAFGRQLRILSPSANRIEPRCRHFSICGGCKWQNLKYEDQLSYKAKFITDALERIGKIEALQIDPPIGAIEPFFSRNKMEYSFGDDDHQPTAGLHIKGRFDAVFDLEECHLQSQKSVEILHLVRELARRLEIPFYSYKSGTGELRFLVVREGKLTGDLLLNIVTFNRDFPNKEQLFDQVVTDVSGLTSLFHTVNGKKANVATGEELFLIHGQSHIRERVGDLLFQISPFSFFQTNSRQTELLYNVIVDHAQPAPHHDILDLFCGCGTIGLYLARRVNSVFGIEINEDAIKMAEENTRINGIDNATFRAGDVKLILNELHEQKRMFNTVVTDPPRAGMERRVVRRISRLQPERIVAVSCNPATLARDLNLFIEHGYCVKRVTPIDMFPQTAHIEAVVTLEKELPGANCQTT